MWPGHLHERHIASIQAQQRRVRAREDLPQEERHQRRLLPQEEREAFDDMTELFLHQRKCAGVDATYYLWPEDTCVAATIFALIEID